MATGEPSYNDLVSKIQIGDGTAYIHALRASAIPYGQVDSTSTATAFTATVPGINVLKDGVCVLLKNGVVTSASGFTINVNGLGAKPSYTNLAAATRDTTIFNIGYTMLFIYDEDRVSGGCWICYRGYDANTNTIGYQIRSNSSTLPAADKGYRYRLWFTSADGAKWVPANTSTSTDATTSRNPNTTPINPFGPIVYNSTNDSVSANADLPTGTLWQQYTLTVGYSFNEPGGSMTYPAPVYLKCTPQTNGSAVMVGLTQALPSTDDGFIYIFLGRAYSATAMELTVDHPVFYNDGTGIRAWTGKKPFSGSYADLTNKPSIPTKVSDLTNDEGYITSASVPSASSTTPKMDGTAAVGTETAFARGDHIHPTDTSRQAKITASGILKGNGSGTVTAATAGTDYQAPLTFDGTYSASTNKAATVSTVTNAINALDGGTIGTGSTTKTITSLSQSNGNVSATFSDIAFPVTSVNGSTGAVTTAEKFVIAATAISGTEYYNLDKTYADILNAIGGNKYVSIQDMDATYPYTTITTQGIVFGATLLATSNGQLMAITDGILVVQPDSGTNAMGMAVHSSTVLPTISDIPSASSTTPSMDGTAAVGTGTTWARADHVHPTDTSRAPIASPEFTGTPTAPTATAGTNTTQIATTAFVKKAIEDALFVAEYGVTTYAEISAVLDADKPLFCYVNWNDIVCPYIGIVNNQYAFSSLGAGESTVTLYVNSSNQWSYATTNLATQSAVNAKQDALVSGTNIKTINNESILGSGNISISAGSSDVFIAEYGVTTYADILAAYEAGKAIFCQKIASSSLNNTKIVSILPLAYIGSSDQTASASRKAIFKNMSGNYSLNQTNITSWTVSGVSGQWSSENIETDTSDQGILSINKSGNSTYLYSNTVNGIVKDDGTGVLSAAVAGTDYQAPLVSGTNIKTINNESLLGSGNISISGGSSILFVTVTYANYAYTADTTYANMMSAISNGKDIVLILVDANQQKTWYYIMAYAPKTATENFCFASEDELGTFKHLLVSNTDVWWAADDISLLNYAKKASPAFTGNPTAPTQSAGNNSTRIATTAFVTTAINNAIGSAISASY